MKSSFVGLRARVFSALAAVGGISAIGYYYGFMGMAVIATLVILIGCLEFTHIGFLPEENLSPLVKALFILCAFIFLVATSFLNGIDCLAALGITAVMYLSLLVWLLGENTPLERIRHLSTTSILGFVYTAFLPAFAIRTLFLPRGLEWFCWLLIVVFSGDTAAYFFGLCFGKKKLMVAISPKKTLIGAWGGLLGSGIGSISSLYFIDSHLLIPIVISGTAIGFFAQTGDLFESLLKRVSHNKDSGNIMPGHGGVLDRLDGIYFASPIVFFVAYYID